MGVYKLPENIYIKGEKKMKAENMKTEKEKLLEIINRIGAEIVYEYGDMIEFRPSGNLATVAVYFDENGNVVDMDTDE